MASKIYEKKSALRDKAIRLDLSPDKSYSLKGNMIRYVSIGKLKRQFAPLFTECGLDFKMNMTDVVELPEKTRVSIDFIFTDVESGEQDITRIVADGSNATEKGIVIATSYAMRMFLSNTFCLEDGIDYERAEPVNTVADGLSARAIPPEEPTENTPRTEEEPKEVVQPLPTKKTAEKSKKSLISAVELKAATNAMKKIEELYKAGQIVEDEYVKAKDIYGDLSNSSKVLMLVGIKSAAEKKTKPVREGM